MVEQNAFVFSFVLASLDATAMFSIVDCRSKTVIPAELEVSPAAAAQPAEPEMADRCQFSWRTLK
ncbi:hypothetical protein BH24CHL4_BH24CHL4_24430 [soil metagenome]